MEKLFKITIVLLLSIIIYLLIRPDLNSNKEFQLINIDNQVNLVNMKTGQRFINDQGNWYYFSEQYRDSAFNADKEIGILRSNNPFREK